MMFASVLFALGAVHGLALLALLVDLVVVLRRRTTSGSGTTER